MKLLYATRAHTFRSRRVIGFTASGQTVMLQRHNSCKGPPQVHYSAGNRNIHTVVEGASEPAARRLLYGSASFRDAAREEEVYEKNRIE